MFIKSLIILKVLWKHMPAVIDIIKDCIEEIKKESPESKELSEMEDDLLSAEDL
ncbi:MAG: hypothetical protein FWH53_00500 [Leptospirales bacterium]|nr:hypothetical protein [Leptospirales bacterium]